MSMETDKPKLLLHQRIRAKRIRDAQRFMKDGSELLQQDIDRGIPMPVTEDETVDLTREELYITHRMVDYLCAKLANSTQLMDEVLKEMPEPFRLLYPATSTVYSRLWDTGNRNHDYFRDQFYGARIRQADFMAFEAMKIADDAQYDWVLRAKRDGVVVAFDREHVARSKLRVEQRNLLAKRLNPKEYNLNRTEITGKDGKPLVSGMDLIAKIIGDLDKFDPVPEGPVMFRGEIPPPLPMADEPPPGRLTH